MITEERKTSSGSRPGGSSGKRGAGGSANGAWLLPAGPHLESFLEVAVVVDDLCGSGVSFVSGGALQRGQRPQTGLSPASNTRCCPLVTRWGTTTASEPSSCYFSGQTSRFFGTFLPTHPQTDAS